MGPEGREMPPQRTAEGPWREGLRPWALLPGPAVPGRRLLGPRLGHRGHAGAKTPPAHTRLDQRPQDPSPESKLDSSGREAPRPARPGRSTAGNALLPNPKLPAGDGSVLGTPSGSGQGPGPGFPWGKLLLPQPPPPPRSAPPGTAVPVRPLPLPEVTRDRRLGVSPWVYSDTASRD